MIRRIQTMGAKLKTFALLWVTCLSKFMSWVSPQFITLRRLTKLSEYKNSSGWKIHISINDSLNSDLMRAWNNLVPIFMRHNLTLIKCVSLEVKKDESIHSSEQGRQFTIYANCDNFSSEKWGIIFQEITEKLAALEIEPGFRNPVCKAVNGSHYLSYRNDKSEIGDYLACREVYSAWNLSPEKCYNLSGEKDIFSEITVHVKNQMLPKETLVVPKEHEITSRGFYTSSEESSSSETQSSDSSSKPQIEPEKKFTIPTLKLGGL